MSDDEFENYWMNKLPLSQKKARLERALFVFLRVSKVQTKKLNKYNKSHKEKEIRFMYFLPTVEGVWDNVKFTLSLGKSKNRKFAFYPVRTVFENVLQLEHYVGQKIEGQNSIALREITRIAKRFYEREKHDNGNSDQYKEMYEKVILESHPPIENAPTRDLFPNFEDLSNNSRMNTHGRLYFEYRDLCELTHGKLIAHTIANQDDLSEYVRSLMSMYAMCVNLLKIVDHHIQEVTKDEITEAISIAELIIKKQK